MFSRERFEGFERNILRPCCQQLENGTYGTTFRVFVEQVRGNYVRFNGIPVREGEGLLDFYLRMANHRSIRIFIDTLYASKWHDFALAAAPPPPPPSPLVLPQ